MNRPEKLSITYEGEALQEGIMDFRELSSSLISLGELFEESNRVVNGDDSSVKIQVHADFRRGSFGIDVTVVQDLVAQVSNLFTDGSATASILIDYLFAELLSKVVFRRLIQAAA